MSKALLVLDLINDIVDEKGSVGKDGFYNQAIKRDVVENTSNAIAWFRKKGLPVIYVVVGFSQGYPEWNGNMKVFRNVKDREQVLLNSWATAVCDELTPLPGEAIVIKNRIDPFYNTNLEIILQSFGVDTLYLTGISSDLVVLSSCFSGHDRGFKITVLEDCIAANDEASHACAIKTISKLADISTSKNLIMEEN